MSRRAKAKSDIHAVVVRFSRTRKRYERQGLLVQPGALGSGGSAARTSTRGSSSRRAGGAKTGGLMSSQAGLSLPVTLAELESHLWATANILRGSPVDRTDWKWREHLRPDLRHRRHAHLGTCRGEAKARRAPDAHMTFIPQVGDAA